MITGRVSRPAALEHILRLPENSSNHNTISRINRNTQW